MSDQPENMGSHSSLSESKKTDSPSQTGFVFTDTLSILQQDEFIAEVELLLELLLKLERGVYLESLGLLYPKKSSLRRVDTCPETGESSLVEELVLELDFEKCSDPSALNRTNCKDIVEYREFSQQLYTRLLRRNFGEAAVRFSLEQCQLILKSFFELIRFEVIAYGCSQKLAPLGTLYTLHNRQGNTAAEWFAGADVFISSAMRWVLSNKTILEIEQPVLKHSGEPFEALYGNSIHSFELDAHAELPNLGFEVASNSEQLHKLPVNVYQERQEQRSLLRFVSAGFSNLCKRSPVELVFSVIVPDVMGIPQTEKKQLERFAAPILMLCWLLLQGSRSGTLKSGTGISSDVELLNATSTSKYKTSFKHAFISPYRSVASPQYLEKIHPDSGTVEVIAFKYLAVVAITDAEAAFISAGKTEHLLNLLRRRNADQINSAVRGCISRKSYFSLNEARGQN